MFTQISWGNYIITVFLLSAGYYLVIGYLFYRNDILQLITGKTAKNDTAVTTLRRMPLVQSFVDEVQTFMDGAAKNKMPKKDILLSLPLLLEKYPTLTNSAFQESVQNLIISECKSYCSIDLSDKELSVLWM